MTIKQTIREQPEALRLADALEHDPMPMGWYLDAAAELRRLYTENERLRAEAVKLRNLRADAIHACALANIRAVELEEVLRLAASLVDELDGLVGESDGVSGLHLNGDVATWDELLPGGRFERLSSLDDLRAALAQREEEGEKP